MADEKDRADWDKWSALIAKLHNCHAGQSHQREPRAFNPYLIREQKREDNFETALHAVVASLDARSGKTATATTEAESG